MKKTILFILLFTFVINIHADEMPWYKHGELYKKNMSSWKSSSLLEKLSLSANYITINTPKIVNITKEFNDMKLEILKLYSTNLSICIDNANTKTTKDISITVTAEWCVISMGWK